MSREGGVAKIKNGVYMKDILKGTTKNDKTVQKVVGSVE